MIYKFYNRLSPLSKSIFHSILVYVSWILVHYMASHMYIYFCVPKGIYGIFASFVLSPSMHCHALRWAIYNGGIHISLIWILLGSVVVKLLCPGIV